MSCPRSVPEIIWLFLQFHTGQSNMWIRRISEMFAISIEGDTFMHCMGKNAGNQKLIKMIYNWPLH